eukprot:GHVQ01011206.1.p1 GENE.GHVQ01011206.1~~GHVQ01011206.1.p1  ORF type:complete len:166 (+),score=17.89 GHVQ01011206.1:278-775(+)
MISTLSRLGCYFSFSAQIFSNKKCQEAVRNVPLNRLLLESDCPDQLPPPSAFSGTTHRPHLQTSIYSSNCSISNSSASSNSSPNNLTRQDLLSEPIISQDLFPLHCEDNHVLNEPSTVHLVCSKVALILNLPFREIASATFLNASRVFLWHRRERGEQEAGQDES